MGPHPTLSKGEDSKERLKVLSFVEDLGEAKFANQNKNEEPHNCIRHIFTNRIPVFM
jgi:hypothetical protein